MRSVGLITEYNPFHNGHLHHLRASLTAAAADVSVAVMSGHFLQRGEPALVDKWVRTEMAISAGVDLVIELPLPWACSSAPDFARGAVQALTALGGVGALCFGSEVGELAPLRRCAAVLSDQTAEIGKRTAELLRDGINYPQARAKLLAERLGDDGVSETLASPNNILGIEYLKALQQTGSSIRPLTIQRIGAGFHQTSVGRGNIASATGIRKMLGEGSDVAELIPAAAYRPLQQSLALEQQFSAEAYVAQLLAQIMRIPDSLTDYWLVEHGIENRLLAVAEQATTLEGLVSGIKSRQLTRTRIQRMLVSVLLGIKKQEAANLLGAGPRYLHLLGCSENGQRFLGYCRKKLTIPLIRNFSRIHANLKRFYGVETREHNLALQQLDLELRATKLYTLLMGSWPGGQRNRDFYQQIRKGAE